MAVSLNGRRIPCPRVEHEVSDLMLVENFH